MLNRINELLNANESFAFETTLSTRSYKNKIIAAKTKGYTVMLIFFWLQSVELARERVKTRVAEGGHNIAPDVIERRYIKGIKNLFDIYLPLMDDLFIFDNSDGNHELILQKTVDKRMTVFNEQKLNQLRKYYDHSRKTN